ncbi:hypothetical protein GOP47_0015508 [Adiantum capillus-veneris]|uniref:Uncharacterized protein n=1 Tax=Adiantum capillus-veneris TaxID=13818 RepID=A0A9D4UKK7_ADICA|nr:hypothetical protein GOP47_0015508 [Adiantum capillus-veneris]
MDIFKDGKGAPPFFLGHNRFFLQLMMIGLSFNFGTQSQTNRNCRKDTAGNGSFFVWIFGSNRVMVGKVVYAVKRLLGHVKDDQKPQNARKLHGSHNCSSDSLARSHMQHIASQQTQYEPNMQPYAGQEASYYDEKHNSMDQLEARCQRETRCENDAFAMAYGLKGGLQYDERPLSKGVSKEDDHGRDEDKENARHRQAIKEIQEQCQQKMVSLRAAQGKRREEFLKHEAHFRQHQYQQYQPQGGSKYYNYDMGGSKYYNYEDEGQGQTERKRGKFEVDDLNAGEEMDGYGEEAEDDDKWATEVAIAKEEMDQQGLVRMVVETRSLRQGDAMKRVAEFSVVFANQAALHLSFFAWRVIMHMFLLISCCWLRWNHWTLGSAADERYSYSDQQGSGGKSRSTMRGLQSSDFTWLIAWTEFMRWIPPCYRSYECTNKCKRQPNRHQVLGGCMHRARH